MAYGMDVPNWQRDPLIKAIVAATFPGYKRRTIKLLPTPTVTLHDLNWSGGTRAQYRACTLEGTPIGKADRYSDFAPWDNPAEGMTLPVPVGVVVVQGGDFCGKTALLWLYVNPASCGALLQRPEAV